MNSTYLNPILASLNRASDAKAQAKDSEEDSEAQAGIAEDSEDGHPIVDERGDFDLAEHFKHESKEPEESTQAPEVSEPQKSESEESEQVPEVSEPQKSESEESEQVP